MEPTLVNRTARLFDLYEQYPLTLLSLSDLHTYELLILIAYAIMLVFSFFTNMIAIVVFSFGRRSHSGFSSFLLNLSIFNIIMTVYCIPFTISSVIFQRWLFPDSLCVVLDAFKRFSITGLLLTLIAVAVDRYCAVKYPLANKQYSIHRRNTIVLLAIWIISFISAVLWSSAYSSPMVKPRLWVNSRSLLEDYLDAIEGPIDVSKLRAVLSKLHFEVVNTTQCVPNRDDRPNEIQPAISNFLQTYFVPLFILAFVYLHIAAILWRRSSNGQSRIRVAAAHSISSHESVKFKRKLKQGIKMLVAAVILYAVLWLPMNVLQLVFSLFCYSKKSSANFCHRETLMQLLYVAFHFLTVSNTAINPIVYGFANQRFRSDIRQLGYRLTGWQGPTSQCCGTICGRAAIYEMKSRTPKATTVNENLLQLTKTTNAAKRVSSLELQSSAKGASRRVSESNHRANNLQNSV